MVVATLISKAMRNCSLRRPPMSTLYAKYWPFDFRVDTNDPLIIVSYNDYV